MPNVENRPATRVDDMDPIESWADLNAWLNARIEHALSYLNDDETAQAYGRDAMVRNQTRVLSFSDVRSRIAPLVERERAAKAIEAAYRAAGFEEMDPLEQRLMDGDR